MTTTVDSRREVRREIENNLDLWEEVDRIVATRNRRPSTEQGGITPVVLLALVAVLISHLIGIYYFVTYQCPCLQKRNPTECGVFLFSASS
jgi:hypothetical protein